MKTNYIYIVTEEFPNEEGETFTINTHYRSKKKAEEYLHFAVGIEIEIFTRKGLYKSHFADVSPLGYPRYCVTLKDGKDYWFTIDHAILF